MWKLHRQTVTIEADEHKFEATFWNDGNGLPWFSIEEVVETSWRPLSFCKPVTTTYRVPVRSGWTEDNRVGLVAAIIRRYLDEDRKAHEERGQIERICRASSCKLVELEQSMISEVSYDKVATNS